jgi:cholesterol transport system auxiliary component
MMSRADLRAARIASILAGALMLAACGGSTPETFDLNSAAVHPAQAHKLRAQLAIREPIASLDLDSQRIVVRTGPESLAYLSGAQWSDRLPALVQSRLVQTFQDAHLLQSVARAGSGPPADYSLELDIRTFELDVKALQANVDIAAKILESRNGRIVATRIFKSQVPAAGTSGPQATAALDAALSNVMAQIVAFASAEI